MCDCADRLKTLEDKIAWLYAHVPISDPVSDFYNTSSHRMVMLCEGKGREHRPDYGGGKNYLPCEYCQDEITATKPEKTKNPFEDEDGRK